MILPAAAHSNSERLTVSGSNQGKEEPDISALPSCYCEKGIFKERNAGHWPYSSRNRRDIGASGGYIPEIHIPGKPPS